MIVNNRIYVCFIIEKVKKLNMIIIQIFKII